MICDILPAGAAGEESFTDDVDGTVFPEERAAVLRAVVKRRREFTTVRILARRASSRLGVDVGPLVPGARGEPPWPPGIVGSLTHCAGYRAAAVARAVDIAGLGIDAEPAGALPDGVEALITAPLERRMLRGLRDEEPSMPWPRLLFSAKESVYKAWYPITLRWLGFEDVTLVIDRASRSFDVHLPDGALPQHTMQGRWHVGHGFIVTAVTVVGAGGHGHRGPVQDVGGR